MFRVSEFQVFQWFKVALLGEVILGFGRFRGQLWEVWRSCGYATSELHMGTAKALSPKTEALNPEPCRLNLKP